MTLDEAFQELGIEPRYVSYFSLFSPDEIRQAYYLRAIKTRTPENDPEGFRRVHEAYKLFCDFLSEQFARVPADIARSKTLKKENAEENTPLELPDLVARLSKLPSETHMEDRLAVLRQAMQEHPTSPGVRWALVRELRHSGLEQELLAVLRAGSAAGFPGFLKTQAACFPDSVDQDDLARLENSHDLDSLSVAAKVYLHRAQPGKAVAALNRVIDRLWDHEDPASRPLPSWLPRMMLALEAAGLSQDARALHDRLWQRLSATRDANVDLLLGWRTIYWWNVAHELGQLDPAFPADLRRSAAQAALSGNEVPAVEKAKRFAKATAKQAEQASKMLYGLPLLHNLYYLPLQGIWPGAKVQTGQTMSGLGTFAWILLFIVANVLGRSCPNSSEKSGLPTAKAQQLRDQAYQAWAALEGSCDGSGRSMPRSSCEIMWRTVHSMESGNCSGALRTLKDLEDSLAGAGSDDLARISRFERVVLPAITTSCGPYQVMP